MISKLQASKSNRPIVLPSKNWSYFQEWKNVFFLHWKIDANLLRTFVPQPLEIDLIDGFPWISLVGFNMVNLHPKYLPSIAAISNFHELNIRTYVKYKDVPGVYFLNIEASKLISAFISRKISGLPYKHSRIIRKEGFFEASNKRDNSFCSVKFGKERLPETKDFTDLQLTERYALFCMYAEQIYRYDIHHLEWPIHKLSVEELNFQYPRFQELGLTHETMDRAHWSLGVEVFAWKKNRC
jgi:uncharacterized protein YqjF (DUF2071 family)